MSTADRTGVKVDAGVHQEIARGFRIRSSPTLALLSGGREIERTAGAKPAAETESFASHALDRIHRHAS